MKKRYYTTAEAAIELGYNDDRYIRRLIKAKKLQASKIARDWVISRNDLDKFLIDKKLLAVQKDIIRNPDL